MRDLLNDINPRIAIAHAALAAGVIANSEIFDRSGYESATFVFSSLIGGDATFEVLEGDLVAGAAPAIADMTVAPEVDVIGQDLSAMDGAPANSTRKIAYKGGKQFMALRVTAGAAATDGGALIILGDACIRPVVNPPA